MKYDVIVGGGGPAGSISAYLLAKQGIKTLLIEKERLPRYKPCGGGIPLKTNRLFPFDISPAYEVQAEGAVINYQGIFLTRIQFDQPYGWLVMRDRLDQYLIEQAAKAGAAVMEDTTISGVFEKAETVEVHTGRGSFIAQYLIGADGVNSQVAQSLGLLPNRKTGAALEAEVTVPPPAQQEQRNYLTFDFGAIPGGYGWIFPKKDHLSIGIFQANNRKSPGFRKKLTEFIQKTPVLKESKIAILRGHRIPLGGDYLPLHAARTVLVGDAANLADAWLGEGIFYAITSASIAAEVLSTVLNNPAFSLSVYTERIHQEICPQLQYARKIAAIIYRFPRATSLMTARSSIMQNGICSSVYGDINNEQLYKMMLKRSISILYQTIRGELDSRKESNAG